MINIDEILLYESSNLELKSDRPKEPSKYLKTVAAFSNGLKPSYLIFGIDDKLKTPTQVNVEAVQKRIMNEIESQVIPRVIPNFSFQNYKGHNVLVIEFLPGSQTPYRLKSNHKVYIRNAEATVEANSSEINELILRGKNTTQDALITQYKTDELVFDYYAQKYQDFKGQQFEKNHCSKFGMINGVNYNVASLLISDSNDLDHTSSVFALFKGKNRINVIDKKNIGGSLVSQVDILLSLIKRYSKKVITTKELKRNETDEYHFEAVREAIVNSFVHRDYSLIHSNNTVYMYDDRIEITSIGVPPSPIKDIQDLLENPSSIRRNPILCRLFDEIGYMEQMGRGILNILEIYKGAYMKPDFHQENMNITVTFYSLKYYQDRRTLIINHIEEYGFITSKDVMNMEDVKDSAARKILRKMQEEGYIKKESDSKPAKYILA